MSGGFRIVSNTLVFRLREKLEAMHMFVVFRSTFNFVK